MDGLPAVPWPVRSVSTHDTGGRRNQLYVVTEPTGIEVTVRLEVGHSRGRWRCTPCEARSNRVTCLNLLGVAGQIAPTSVGIALDWSGVAAEITAAPRLSPIHPQHQGERST